MVSRNAFIIFLGLAILLALTACNQVQPTAASTTAITPTLPGSTPSPSQPATATPTPSPSPTPQPLAASVNNEGISLAAYSAELQRFQAALSELGKEMSPQDQQSTVLQQMIDQVLLAQAAQKSGYTLSDADFQKRLDDVIAKNGGASSFADWLSRNFYTEDSFRAALRLSLAAAWERDQLIATVPTSAEQVHARQILVLNEDLANSLYAQLQAGADFATLALKVDPDTGGELGWFPRGYLLVPEIEKAAFDLQPGQYSPVIKTSYGYQIVYVIERDPNRPLSPDARAKAQRTYLDNWLKDQRSQSQIEILLK